MHDADARGLLLTCFVLYMRATIRCQWLMVVNQRPCVCCYHAQAGIRNFLQHGPGDFSVQLTSTPLLQQAVAAMVEHRLGCHNDVSGGMTAEYEGKATKVFMISIPHHHRVLAADGLTAKRLKGTSPLPISIVVTTATTGNRLTLQWVMFREQLEIIKPGWECHLSLHSRVSFRQPVQVRSCLKLHVSLDTCRH